ncbi:APC family permease [Pseudoduganella sp. RAF19]|uniref:APC family permease n=1 Tax=Pseudoduganella sp. RAF19 TaxID=3233052 RepID=UPI003F9C5C40
MSTALIVGNVIGMGIFLLPVSLAPYGINAFAGWAATVTGCLFVAYTFAQLARSLPEEDGPYGYTRRAFGNGVAFFVMWSYWVSIWITNAALAIGLVGYLVALVPPLAHVPSSILALAMVWFFVLINLRGAKTSGRVQLISVGLKLLPMIAVVVLRLVAVMSAQPIAGHLAPAPLTLDATAAAGTIALFTVLGVECATIPAGKIDRPEVTIPRATIAGTAIIAVVYVCVSAAPLLLLPHTELARSEAPFAALFDRYWGQGWGQWLSAFIVISGLGCLNGWTLVAGEVTASLAANGTFPDALQLQNRRGAPARALVLVGVLASVMVGMSYSRSLADAFTFLTVMVTAASLPLYLFGGLALFKLWRRGVVRHAAAGVVAGAAGLSCSRSGAFTAWARNPSCGRLRWVRSACRCSGMPATAPNRVWSRHEQRLPRWPACIERGRLPQALQELRQNLRHR